MGRLKQTAIVDTLSNCLLVSNCLFIKKKVDDRLRKHTVHRLLHFIPYGVDGVLRAF